MQASRVEPHAEPGIDITPEQWSIVKGILAQRVPQFSVWAFGSRITGKAKPYSDLDIAVITCVSMDLSASAALADDFEESDLPFKVDVVD